jgi:hypothetical protein
MDLGQWLRMKSEIIINHHNLYIEVLEASSYSLCYYWHWDRLQLSSLPYTLLESPDLTQDIALVTQIKEN